VWNGINSWWRAPDGSTVKHVVTQPAAITSEKIDTPPPASTPEAHVNYACSFGWYGIPAIIPVFCLAHKHKVAGSQQLEKCKMKWHLFRVVVPRKFVTSLLSLYGLRAVTMTLRLEMTLNIHTTSDIENQDVSLGFSVRYRYNVWTFADRVFKMTDITLEK